MNFFDFETISPQGWDQQLWHLVGWTMCYFLAVGTLVALVGAIVRVALRRFSPSIRYCWSLSVLFVLAIMPLGLASWLASSLPTESMPFASTPMTPPTPAFTSLPENQTPRVIDLKDQPLALDAAQQLNTAERYEPVPAIDLPTASASVATESQQVEPQQNSKLLELVVIGYLPWLWIVGTPLTFLLLATGLIGSQRLRKHSKLVTEGPIHATCQRLRKSLAVSQRVAVAINQRIASPLLVGIVRPTILLPPAALTGWSPEQIEMVLLHELAHVRRCDNLVNFLQRVIEALLFFHPCVWWVSRWVRHDREECCDALVVARTAKPQAYAELLVALATPPQPLAGLAMAQHPLTGRIRKILQLEDEKMLVSRSTITLAGLALASLLAVLLWTPVENTMAEETNQAVVDEKDFTTEDTESAEEQQVDFAESDSYTFTPDTPQKVINEAISLIEAKGQDATLRLHEDGTITVSRVEKKTPPTPTQPAPSVFLSLEDQRAADLAYKLLNLELEPLNEKELQRVKKLKFDGGMKAVAGQLDLVNGIRKGDLLVGLHVWPTTSLADVKKILQRDDIADLSPLKFYVLRETKRRVTSNTNRTGGMGSREGNRNSSNDSRDQNGKPGAAGGRGGRGGYGGEGSYGGEYGGYGGEFGGGYGGKFGSAMGAARRTETVDELVTGRIAVNVNAIKKPVTSFRNVPVPTIAPPATRDLTAPVYAPAPSQPTTPLNPVPAGSPLGNRAKPTLLFFCDPNNSEPCKKMQPIIRQLSKQMKDQIDVVEVDITQSPGMAKTYQVKRVPTCLVFQHNKLNGKYTGGPDLQKIKKFILDRAKPQLYEPAADTTAPIRSAITLNPYNLAPGDQIKIVVTGAYPDQPIADVYTIEDMGTVALGPTYGRIKVAGLTVIEAEKKIKQQLSEILTDVAVQVTIAKKAKPTRVAEPLQTYQRYAAPPPALSLRVAAQKQQLLIQQAQLAAKTAQLEHDRLERLHQKGVVSTLELQKARAKAENAALELKKAEIELKAIEEQAAEEKEQADLQATMQHKLAKLHDELRAEYRKKSDAYEKLLERWRDLQQSGSSEESAVREELNMLKSERDQLEAIVSDLSRRLSQQQHQTNTKLLYDNKTFDQWRSLWKNELRTETRTEAIKALAAFGRAGYGKEAAEAILDVAGEYDFYMRDGSAEGHLKEKVLEVLNNPNGQNLDPALWLESLLSRYESKPQQWKWLAWNAVSMIRLTGQDEAVKQRVLEVARSDDEFLRGAARGALASAKVDDADVREFVETLFAEAEKQELIDHSYLLVKYAPDRSSPFGGGGGIGGGGSMPEPVSHARSIPALLNALRYLDLEVRRATRQKIRHLENGQARQIIDAMLEDLKSAETSQQRIIALRTIAVFGPKAKSVEPTIRSMIKQLNEEEQIAAGVAIDRINDDKKKMPARSLVIAARTGLLKESDGSIAAQDKLKVVSHELYDSLKRPFEKEAEMIFPAKSKPDSGGGFF